MARYCSTPNAPLGRWNNLPIYLTTIVTALFVLGLIVFAVLGAQHSPAASLAIFTAPLVPAWSLWRLVTYLLVDQISFFTPFGLFCFYWWSVGIETHLGRSVVTGLWVLVALASPAVAALGWLGFGIPSETYGNYVFVASLLVAFATLYPQTEAWGWVPFKWVAFACIVCGSLMLLAERDWLRLAQLWLSCGVAFAYVRYAREQEFDDAESPFSRVRTWFLRRKFRVLPPPPAREMRHRAEPESAVDSIDPLLDKIAKSGLASLTAGERAKLEKAREDLMKKEAPQR